MDGLNLYCYCANDPVNYKQKHIFSVGSITTSSISESSSVAANFLTLLPSKSSVFNLFGYELRTSKGWQNSPNIATSWFGRIGFSSYVTHTKGCSGMLYAFAGKTSDVMNRFDTTYYAGIGLNILDVIGAEVQLETLGIGAQVNIGHFMVGVNINLIGGTSITFGWNVNLENDMTGTYGFTIGLNTGFLMTVILWIYKVVTTGDANRVPGLQPA